MKTTIMIAIGIMMISLAGAVELLAGESYDFTLKEPFDYWSIVGNLSEVNVTFNGLEVTITPDKYSSTDSFEIIFFNKENKIIYYAVESDSGGGGGGTRTIYKNNTIYVNQTDSPADIDEELQSVENIIENMTRVTLILFIIAIIVSLIAVIYIRSKKKKPILIKEVEDEDEKEEEDE